MTGMGTARMVAEWGTPIAVVDDLDVVCPSCGNPMSIWQDGCDVLAKTAHCVVCQLNFEIKEVSE